MPELPLLVFPSHESANRTKNRIPPNSAINYPDYDAQRKRVSPIFNELQNAFEQRIIEVQQGVDGIDPEQVLVIEIIGSVSDFALAVSKINGLEWLEEIEEDNIIPDIFFYDTKNTNKPLNGRLFLTMSNQRALNELLSLWHRYITDPYFVFPRGLTKFREIFKQLKTIRRWDIEDRFRETGVLSNWQFEIEQNCQNIKFEIELWFRNNSQRRNESERFISGLISEIGGRVITSSIFEEIRYHAILAELPANQIQKIIDTRNTRLVKCDGIMFFRPTGQLVVGNTINPEDLVAYKTIERPLPQGQPVIGLFDGLPLEHHMLLENRMLIDDPDDFSEFYSVNDRCHGTAMSSLIINGDLNDQGSVLDTPLYVRPIMKPSPFNQNNQNIEIVPNDVLFVDLIHRAVRRIFEGEGDFNPIQTIKVINLSIGDSTRMFFNSLSPVARMLDWLSYKYKVLFIISAGNHPNNISFEEKYRELRQKGLLSIQKGIIKKVLEDQRNRRILSPAESINNLTVGALNYDNSEILPDDERINPSNKMFPNTISSFGNGFRRSVKPDLVYYGGQQLYEVPFTENNSAVFRVSTYKRSPGNKVAAPDSSLNKTTYERGTSNATALISREAAACYHTIQNLQDQEHVDVSEYSALMIKCMLVHGCSWESIQFNFEHLFKGEYSKSEIKNILTKWTGYGFPDVRKVRYCTKKRVTIIGFGKLKQDQVHIFKFPLPPSLSLKNIKRKLTITLAWFTPIYPATQIYRTASLYFEADNNNISPNRENADYNAVKRGTLQHEIFVGDKAVAFEDGENISIRVVCKKDSGEIVNHVPYVLAATLEVAEEVALDIFEDVDIYTEVKNRLSVPVAVQIN